jgi:hypothetical protein
MYEGDIIIISTSVMVDTISCNDMTSEIFVVLSNWTLTFDANQSGETCLGTIIDGETEIGFTLTWNYIETIVDSNNTSTETVDDHDHDHDDDDDDDDDEKHGQEGHDGEDKGTVASIILAIIILTLLVYLLVMMRSPNYEEEE